MICDKTIEWARWHAGLTELKDRTTPSIADCLWNKSELRTCIRLATADVIQLFQVLNFEFNGPMPSEDLAKEHLLPRSLVYAIAETLSMLRAGCESERDSTLVSLLVQTLWQVETAWCAVLAGDIDDIAEHLQEEAFARGLEVDGKGTE